MIHSTSILHHNNRFLFSFNPKTSHSLSITKFLSPLSSPSLLLPPPPSSSLSSSSLCCRVARVTEALELSPPAPGFNFHREISRLTELREKLAACATLDDKLRVLDGDSRVRQFFGSRWQGSSGIARVLSELRLGSGEMFLFKCLVAAGQGHVLSSGEGGMEAAVANSTSSVKSALYALAEMIEKLDSYNGNVGGGLGKSRGMALDDKEIRDLNELLDTLGEIEQFYDCIGGIIGYQIKMLELLFQKSMERDNASWSHHRHEVPECQILGIDAPKGLDLSQNTEYASQAALWGIET